MDFSDLKGKEKSFLEKITLYISNDNIFLYTPFLISHEDLKEYIFDEMNF